MNPRVEADDEAATLRPDDDEATTLRPDDIGTISDETATYVQAAESTLANSLAAQVRLSHNHGPDQRYMEQRSLPPRTVQFNPQLEMHAQKFREIVEEYRHSVTEKQIKDLDLSKTHSWDEVFRVVRTAQDKYIRAGQKPVRRASRFLGRQSESVLPFLRIIPNGTYTSMICGGLKSAMHLSNAREEVLRTIEDMPEIILQAEHAVETFPPDLSLDDKADELYLSIFTALQGAVEWFAKNPIGKQTAALVQGPLYNKAFKQNIKALDDALESFKKRCDTLRDGAIVDTHKTVKTTHTLVGQVATTTGEIEVTTKDTRELVQTLQSGAEDLMRTANGTDARLIQVKTEAQWVGEGINTRIGDVQSTQRATRARIEDIHDAQHATHAAVDKMTDVQRAIHEATEAMTLSRQNAEWQSNAAKQIRQLRRKVKRLETSGSAASLSDLLEIIDVDENLAENDRMAVRRGCQSLSASDAQVPHGIIVGQIYTDWVSANDSGALFIEGGQPMVSGNRYTSLSLLSCIVTDVLQQDITIHHFCRRHVRVDDLFHGPKGMMRNLIHQVARYLNASTALKFPHNPRNRKLLESHDLSTLCACFAYVVEQVPDDPVIFCIIDGIDAFEKHTWAAECRKVMNTLQDMAHGEADGPVFKLLVTSPGRSKFVGSDFDDQQRMRLASAGNTSRDNPTPRELAQGARRQQRRRNSEVYRGLRASAVAAMKESSDESSDSELSSASNPD
ncbi:uncharacterized protein AB675_8144 [Cyphellophora attinorum]|uniref:Nephrocystin 3-like N-terminal domain-containing protein n=1 Tax=Cyphellophora attinorum TaxID=1664694 RepID=A0A0N0NN39_9EURO|nr:uncharacterized protein AB675_8144 [Phialophora attinorum]KPI41078.1 hypothetical protein AB675_8144 [Phialophora attinorum]